MIRNVLLGRLKAGVARAEIEPALQAMRDLKIEGIEFTLEAGVDVGMREDTADFALIVDFADEDAYWVYEADPERNRIRNELIAPLTESAVRVQYRQP